MGVIVTQLELILQLLPHRGYYANFRLKMMAWGNHWRSPQCLKSRRETDCRRSEKNSGLLNKNILFTMFTMCFNQTYLFFAPYILTHMCVCVRVEYSETIYTCINLINLYNLLASWTQITCKLAVLTPLGSQTHACCE